MDTFRIKSSGESIVVILHKPINATAFLNYHPFVREKLDYFHNLVVIQFRSCQFVGSGQFFFQSLISRNRPFPVKSQFESLAMDGFVDIPITVPVWDDLHSSLLVHSLAEVREVIGH